MRIHTGSILGLTRDGNDIGMVEVLHKEGNIMMIKVRERGARSDKGKARKIVNNYTVNNSGSGDVLIVNGKRYRSIN